MYWHLDFHEENRITLCIENRLEIILLYVDDMFSMEQQRNHR
jgi:hypothetical protein